MSKNTSNYFPFGFRYPKGLHHDEQNPDPWIEDVRDRMAYLNEVHALSGLPGHVFSAAIDLFQSESLQTPDIFWNGVRNTLTKDDVVEVVRAIVRDAFGVDPDELVKNPNLPVPGIIERLDFPNAIALFDCRFVSTPEWEHIRRYSIGGSEAAAVLGLSHFQSPRSLFYEKRNPAKKEKDVSRDQILDYGHSLEDYIVESFASQLGAVRVPEFRMFAHKEFPFLTCNPDGLFVFADGTLSLFEAKTAFWKKRADWKDGIPPYYAPQPRHYLEVLNDPRLNDGYIGVCLGGGTNDLILHHYLREKDKGAEQVRSLAHFWQAYIVQNEPPELCGNPELDMNATYGYIQRNGSVFQTEYLPDDAIADFQRYFDLQAKRKDIDAKKNAAKKEETFLLNEFEAYFPDGISICAIPGEMPFRIKVKDKSNRTVDLSAFRPGDLENIISLEDTMREKSLPWSTPKISKKQVKIAK